MDVTLCKCGGKSVFLRAKGSNTGLYCGECGSWIKWVGKKDMSFYTRRGLKVNPEHYNPFNTELEYNTSTQPIHTAPKVEPFSMPTHCDSCGSTKFFLRKKTSNIGLYCEGCDKWQQWIGKKVLPSLKTMGYIVHEEDYVSQELSFEEYQNQQDQAKEQQAFGLAEDYSDFDEEDFSDEAEFEEAQPTIIPHERTETGHDTFDQCLTCRTGIMDTIALSDTVYMHIFEKIASIKSKDNTVIHGNFKLNFCPECGRKL